MRACKNPLFFLSKIIFQPQFDQSMVNLTPITGRKAKSKSCSSWLGFCNEQLQLCSHLRLRLFD